jgi:hypothetical protein
MSQHTQPPQKNDTTAQRNRFAAAAITGILSNPVNAHTNAGEAVADAFDVAELMMRESERRIHAQD